MGSRHQIYFSWELNHHNAYLANHDLLRVMLTAVREAGTETGFRKEFARRLSATGLPDNVRSDSKRSDLWRDYQQLLKEWNLVSFGSKEVHLSALGEVALDVSLPNAIALAVFRFQYPNPYKRRFPKWPRKSQEPAVVETDWCAYLSRHGVALRPAVVIARLLTAATGRTRIPHISASDIRDRLFRITREPHSDDELLDRYLAPADSDWKGDRNRNASEWIRALTATGLFVSEDDQRHLRVHPEKTHQLHDLVQRVRSEELWQAGSPEVLHEDFESQDGRKRSQASCLIPKTQPGRPPEDQPIGRSNSASSKIKLRPYTRYRFYPPGTVDTEGFDSILAMARQRRSEHLHEEIVEALAEALKVQGFSPECDPNSIDLLVRDFDFVRLYEVKTIEQDDWVDRTRLAVGQLLEYQSRYLQDFGVLPRLTVVLSRRVSISEPVLRHLQRLEIELVFFSPSDGKFEPLSF